MGKGGGLYAQAGEADELFPPVRGWKYNDASEFGSNWLADTSLECSSDLSTPCKEIRVELGGKASTSNGVYLPVDGEYRQGRQVDTLLFSSQY